MVLWLFSISLMQLGLTQWLPNFKNARISPKDLKDLSHKMLERIGINCLGDRLRIINEAKAYSPLRRGAMKTFRNDHLPKIEEINSRIQNNNRVTAHHSLPKPEDQNDDEIQRRSEAYSPNTSFYPMPVLQSLPGIS